MNNVSDLTLPVRLRKAILGLGYNASDVRMVTIDDILSKWILLIDSGYFPDHIQLLANEKAGLSEEIFKRLMKSMNSYL